MGISPMRFSGGRSVLNGRHRGGGRFGSGRLAAAAAALDEERQKEKHVDRENREKNLFEPFAPMELWIAD
jgi:hypothetical protein